MGDQFNKNEVGWACSTGEESEARWGKLRERENLEYLGIDGRIILKWIFKKWDGVHELY